LTFEIYKKIADAVMLNSDMYEESLISKKTSRRLTRLTSFTGNKNKNKPKYILKEVDGKLRHLITKWEN
jgi:hypothetical protein